MRLTPLACLALLLLPVPRLGTPHAAQFHPTGTDAGRWAASDYEVAPLDASSSVTDLAVAANGDLIVVGSTRSTRFPLTADALDRTCEPVDEYGLCSDAFLMILDATGGTRYATYLGGNGHEWNVSVAPAADGSVWALIGTASTMLDASLTACNGHQPTLVRFSPGAPAYSSVVCIGGPGARQTVSDLALGPDGSAWVATQDCDGTAATVNALQPVLAGRCDIYVARYVPEATAPALATYIGGTETDGATAIATTPDGDLLISGVTQSRDFPRVRAVQKHHGGEADPAAYDLDGFLLRLDVSGRYLEFSTWLGGARQDEAHAVASDADGNAYVAGGTWSDDFPVSSGAMGRIASPGGQDVFVASVAADGHLRFSARLGGRSAEAARALAVWADGSVLLSGQTSSPDFPVVTPAEASLPDAAVSELPFLVRTNATATAVRSATLLLVQSPKGIDAGWSPDVRVEVSAFGHDTLFGAGYTVAWHRNSLGEWDARTTGRYIRRWALGPNEEEGVRSPALIR